MNLVWNFGKMNMLIFLNKLIPCRINEIQIRVACEDMGRIFYFFFVIIMENQFSFTHTYHKESNPTGTTLVANRYTNHIRILDIRGKLAMTKNVFWIKWRGKSISTIIKGSKMSGVKNFTKIWIDIKVHWKK